MRTALQQIVRHSNWFSSLSSLFLFSTALLLPCRAAEYVAGKYDQEVLEIFRTTMRLFTLGASKLKEIAPEYYLKRNLDCTWQEAKKKAQEQFPDNPDKRALFLSKYIKAGDSVTLIDELRIPDLGYSTLTGVGKSKSYGLYVTYNEGETLFFQPEAKAILTFWISHGRVVQAATLCLREYRYQGIEFFNLVFDQADILTSFDRFVSHQDGFTIRVAGNLSGTQRNLCYYARILKGDTTLDSFTILDENHLCRP